MLLGIALMGFLGCASSGHTVEPFKSDAWAATALSARADQACRDRAPAQSRVLIRPFVTDGCSFWPDDDRYVACCVEHDIEYWCGGSREQRAAADEAFEVCVANGASPGLASVMRFGLGISGHPIFPVPYRWGYGSRYRGGYPSDESPGPN